MPRPKRSRKTHNKRIKACNTVSNQASSEHKAKYAAEHQDTGVSIWAPAWSDIPADTPITNEWVVEIPPPLSEKEIENERIKQELVNWPWTGAPARLVTICPFLLRSPDGKTTLPYHEQHQSQLLTMLNSNSLIRDKIGLWLFGSHSSASKFAATCQNATNLMTQLIHFWDMSSGWFHNCDEPLKGPGAPTEPYMAGSVRRVVVVTPVRYTEGQPSYSVQMKHLFQMSVGISAFSDFFHIINFHRVPFLTTNLLALLVPLMRNLKSLGIYACPLIHIGNGIRLFDIISTDKPLGKEKQVNLDFFPNYHVGPVEEPGNPYSVGSYGVTWDNWGGDSCLAIWALAQKLILKARSHGIDFESKHTAFRQWLDKSPCYNVEETLPAMMSQSKPVKVKEDFEEFEQYMRRRRSPASHNLQEPGDLVPYDERARLKALKAKFPAMIRAVALIDQRNSSHRGNVKRFTALDKNRPEGWEWAIKKYPCTSCKMFRWGIFFSYAHIKRLHDDDRAGNPTVNLKCLGCHLTVCLNYEQDHYKLKKRKVIEHWLYNGEEWNMADIRRALSDFHDRNVMDFAARLDDLRKHDMAGPDGYDHELHERQVPLTKKETNGKMGFYYFRSPDVFEKERLTASDPSTKQYQYMRYDRYKGYGGAPPG